MNKLITSIMCMLLAFGSYAQNLKLPEDPTLADEAKRQFALAVDNMGIKEYRAAANSLNWLMKNAPGLYDGLYVNGYKAYEELAGKASGDEKTALLDSMFVCYKLKDEIYKLNTREQNNMAYRYYKYWKSNRAKVMEGLAAYERVYATDANKVINNNLVSYMDMIRRAKAYGNDIPDDKALEAYFLINEVIDFKDNPNADHAKFDRYREAVSGLLMQTIGEEKLNCEFINENLAPGLDQKEDLKLAKKVFGLLLSRECSDSPYFMKAASIIQKEEPTEGLAKVLAQRYAVAKDYEKAMEYYNMALEMSADDSKRAELRMDIAKIFASQGEKSKARSQALEAAKLDSEVAKEAYSMIGGLYMGSFEDCAKKQSQVDDRAIFMAAYDMYQRAGDQAGMRNAQAQFPTKSDVFTANKQEGETISIGCWIGGSTKIKARASDN